LNEPSDRRRTWQPDIYQRYSFLARLTDILFAEGGGSPTLLDVGSGPIALTEQFVSPGFAIVRADVSQFDDPSIVLLQAGEPLPFEDAAFDVAVAVDVLEHVPPAQRPNLIRELQRVSRQATIVCCPVDTPEVVEAERRFSAWAQAVSGRDIDFLEEHRELGLPDAGQVVSWFSDPGSVVVADNAPLDDWQAFNVLDFIYACDLGDREEKARFAAAFNAKAPLARSGAAHYRRFFCAFTSPTHAATAARMIDEAKSADPSASRRLVGELVDGILGWRQELRERFTREVEAFRRHVGELDATLVRFKEALAEKDAHIGKLDDALAQKEGSAAAQRVRQHAASTALAAALRGMLTSPPAPGAVDGDPLEDAQRQADALREEVDATRARLLQRTSALSAEHARLEESTQRAAAVERELQAILASRSWRLTAPMRRFSTALGRARLNAPLRGLTGIRRWARERATRRRHYALARDSGLFDATWYRERYPDVRKADVDPLVHYLKRGAREGRDPHPLFACSFYLQSNPDVRAAGVNPLVHYLTIGGFEGRDPHPYFDSSFYLESNPDVLTAGLNPLRHYVSSGASEGRAPHPDFDPAFYLASNPDVAAAGMNPLVHYVTSGRAEGRAGFAPGASASGRRAGYVPPQGRLPWFNPLNLVVSPRFVNEPRLNVLVPGLAMRHLSGGPNTALEIAGRLALSGVRVRLISTEVPFDEDRAPFRAHMRRLLGTDLPEDVQLVSTHDRAVPLAIGARDVFMATAWWTAQQAKYAVQQTQHSRFVYLIQDYEPLLHPASTQQALAAETYSLDHIPVVNSQSLHEFLVRQRIGRFADPAFVGRSLLFQPAVDRTLFFPAFDGSPRKRRRLLFYARPTNGLRNLFELGVAALEKVVADGTLDPEQWEFVGMGESFQAVSLGRGARLVPAPWLDLAGYAQQMRESDILLSLMMSPHPSYPPLEMAACGGLAVTTAFANKTSEALAALSANIIAVAPTLEGISEGLEAALARLDDVEGRRAAAAIDLPASWQSSLAEVVPRLFDELAVLQGSPVRTGERSGDDEATSRVAPGFQNWPRDEYEVHRLQAFARRRGQYPLRQEPGLFSLVTTVWNTPAKYLDALADSVLGQDADSTFEWVLLDNGSTDPGARQSIERLARERAIRVFRVDSNLGIVGGMRFCLERATHRYILPLDSDDLLTPDCLRVLSHALRQAGYPALAYTDEDKLQGTRFSQPYLKPAFDPVLFASSCYTAHLGAIDRELALKLGAYTDRAAEGSHDWDTFTRFLAAGHTPLHIPEVLYSWRIHETSTSGNIHSKPFVYDSQRSVLTRLLETLAPAGRFRVEPSPLFGGMPDWWLRRDVRDPRAVTTVVLASSRDVPPRVEVPKEIPHEVVHLDPAAGVLGLARLATQAAERGRLLHVLWHDTRIVDDAWTLEAMGLFELFPDTAMVGGRLHQNGRIIHAGAYFGFGLGCDAPDRGRPLQDPGYFAQAWKPHSVSAVALDHCVLDSGFAANALATLVPSGVSLDQLGDWLGAAARRQRRRVIYTPFLSAIPGVDRGSRVSAVARRAFVTVHGDLMPDALLWPPSAGLMRGRPFRSMGTGVEAAWPGEPEAPLSYEQELEADRLARDIAETPAARDVAFSVMTSVYARSPVEPFDAAIRSMLAQTHQRFEWIVFRDGPVSAGVQAMLHGLAREPRVRVIEGETCRGIQHGFRTCLEAATSEWIVPIDADDVLEADALAVLASTIASRPADFVFSDEDHLIDGQPRSRYVRPGFDPVLNIESSYIWHLSAFRRDRALALGAYLDSGAELCHDWDTSTRFAQAGAVMVHVPHVLYHWRSHEASSSHRPTQNPGTVASTRAVLERTVAGQPSPSRYELAVYPIYRGAVEWWIRRRPIDPPSFGVVLFGADEQSRAGASTSGNLALARTVVAIPRRMETPDDWRRLGEALSGDADYAVVLGERWRPEGEDWLWEAIKWFELLPDTAIVGGRLVDDHGIVVDAGLGRRGHQVLPVYRGLPRTEPGAFALALKAQTIHAPAEGFFVGQRAFLRSAVESVLRGGFSASFAATLGALARNAGRRVVYSPLLEARHLRDVRPTPSAVKADRPASVPGESMVVGSA
jgi:glycosyltransferase involved in cell wall biosynthesis